MLYLRKPVDIDKAIVIISLWFSKKYKSLDLVERLADLENA